MLIHRLPTVMAFVINLGIPPLLFAQVLYGRALYTSSVLIGTYWISVILLLMASYYGLYMSAGLAAKQPRVVCAWLRDAAADPDHRLYLQQQYDADAAAPGRGARCTA